MAALFLRSRLRGLGFSAGRKEFARIFPSSFSFFFSFSVSTSFSFCLALLSPLLRLVLPLSLGLIEVFYGQVVAKFFHEAYSHKVVFD